MHCLSDNQEGIHDCHDLCLSQSGTLDVDQHLAQAILGNISSCSKRYTHALYSLINQILIFMEGN